MSIDQIVGLVLMGAGLLDVFLAVGVIGPKLAESDQRRVVVYGLIFGGIAIGGVGVAYFTGALTLG